MVSLTMVSRMIRSYGHINWALADQAMVSGANVLTGILLARFLGVEGFGTYTLAWAVLLFVASVHLPLIAGSMMSIGPKQTAQEAPAYYCAVIVQNLVFSLAGMLLVFAGAELSHLFVRHWDVGPLAFPLAAATFATVWQEFFRRYFYTRSRPAMAFVVDAIRYLGQISVLLFLFIYFPAMMGTSSALWIVACAAAVPAVLSLLFLGSIAWRTDVMRPIAARHFNTAKWMVISEPIEWASEYVFMFATGTLLGPAAVGALRASQNVAAMTSILFLGLLNVVPSRSAWHFHQGGVAALNKYLRRVTKFGAPATGAICLVFAAFPAFWLNFFFGEEFVAYGELVRWWALVYTVNFLVLPLRSGLRALERTRPVFTARLGGGIFAVLAASFLISEIGLPGAAIGVLGTKIITVCLMWWLFRRSQAEELAGHAS